MPLSYRSNNDLSKMEDVVMSRTTMFLLLVILLSGCASTQPQTPIAAADNLERDSDRLGMDYRRIELSVADPLFCQSECGV
jgi:predicted component of type VI protein secretion system